MLEDKTLEFIELSSDTAFKYLYKNPKTRPWIDNIIKKKFGLELKEYKLIDNEMNTGNNKKDYRLDINLNKDNNYIIVEMNNDYYTFIFNKSYQYLYRTLGSLYKEGEVYDDRNAKLIMFNNFKNKVLPELKVANFKLLDKDNGLAREEIESYEIYLPNFKETCYHKVNEEDVSLSLFTCSSYDEMRSKTNNPKDIEIIEELERLAMNNSFIFDYHHENDEKLTKLSIRDDARREGLEEGRKEGIQEGIKEGIIEGIEKRNIEIAKSLLHSKLSIEEISKHTNLSIEEIENLKD